MKQDGKINHEGHGFDAFGISGNRINEIDMFLKDLTREGYEKRLKRSQVVERIIDFAESMTEAVVIFGYLESMASKGSKPVKALVEIRVGDHEGNEVPDEVKEAIMEVIKDIHDRVEAEKTTGLSVDKDGKII